MKFPYLLLIIILIHQSKQTEKQFTLQYLYEIKIGEKLTDIKMLIDSTLSTNIIFSNTDRPYAQKILSETELDLFEDSIEINDQVLQNFSFNVKDDYTNTNNTKIQGIFGLGISISETNDLIDKMKNEQLIKKKLIYINTPLLKIQFQVNKLKNETKNFNNCSLTDKYDLDEKYYDSWICEYSHILIGNKTNNLTWNDSMEINGRAIFDTTSSFITIPIEYYEMFEDLWEINNTNCKPFINNFNETLFSCNVDKKIIENFEPLYFVLNGFAYKVESKDLFNQMNGIYYSLIHFRKEKNNIWTFGYPFIKNYEIRFDYDEKIVGIKGKNILNFTKEYLEEYEGNQSFLKKISSDKKAMIGAVIIGSLILIFILFFIFRSLTNKSPKLHSELIEDELDR